MTDPESLTLPPKTFSKMSSKLSYPSLPHQNMSGLSTRGTLNLRSQNQNWCVHKALVRHRAEAQVSYINLFCKNPNPQLSHVFHTCSTHFRHPPIHILKCLFVLDQFLKAVEPLFLSGRGIKVRRASCSSQLSIGIIGGMISPLLPLLPYVLKI